MVLALTLACAVALPSRSNETFVDQAINRQTIQHMRAGSGYYAAMARSLSDNRESASSVRAFREPTLFLFWRALPSQTWVWWAFCAMVAAVGLILLRATSAPLVVPLVVLYLLRVGRPIHDGVLFDQYLITELWVALPVAALVLARSRRREGWAALAGFVATVTRETAVVLLIGGLIAAVAGRRRIRPWLTALVALLPAAVAHAALASRHLVAHGSQARLLGTGGVGRVVSMGAVGLPDHAVALALWVLALLRLARDRDLALQMSGLVALPLLGLMVGRDYWGFLVVPFIVLWAGEGVDQLVRSRTPTPSV